MLSGVPQGSHLGPLLFTVFVNDILSCFLNSYFLMFADDLKFYMRIQSRDDCFRLQSDLERLAHWCDLNGMDLNIRKCHLMVFGRSRTHIQFHYNIEGCPLQKVSQVKDLGVTLDEKLSFVTHISSVVSKSLQILGLIKRSSRDFLNTSTMKLLYCALVRPHLEYCSSVWTPYYNVHVRAIEGVQHKFLRYICFREGLDVENIGYCELEKSLNITSLQTRRIHKDLCNFYSLLHSISFSPALTAKIGLHVPSRQTRQNQSFYVPPHRTNYGLNSFISRSARLANRYSDCLDCFSDPRNFRRQLNGCI